MSFSDLLKKPLPSKAQSVLTEAAEDIAVPDGIEGQEMDNITADGNAMNTKDDVTVEGCKGGSGCGTTKEGCATEGCKPGVPGCKTEGCATEGCKGGSGCGTSTEACKTEGCATEGCKTEGCATEGCKGGSGCGASTEACKTEGCATEGGAGCGSSKKCNPVMESDDEDDDEEDDDDEMEDEGDESDLEDIDLDSLSDEDLKSMEEELKDSDVDDAAGDVDPVDLSAEEEKTADDLMSLTATTELIRSELSADDQKKFYESAIDTQIAVFEGFMLESDVQSKKNADESILTEAKMYNKTTVRLSRDDRKAQLYAVAINVSARAHNDPDYIKYEKVLRMRRVLRKRLEKKYHAEAIRRMKTYFARLKSSKSNILSTIGKKITGNQDSK